MKKTAIIGASGFIGGHLLARYRHHYPDTIGTSFSSSGTGLAFFDIRNPSLSALSLEDNGYQSVIITSAKANIDFCERNPEESQSVNVDGMLRLIEQLGKASLECIFLSTDYVFEGTHGLYRDQDETRPTTRYGRQKAQVEGEIPSLVEKFLIIRLSKIFGIEKEDGTLITALAKDLREGRIISAARDQFFCPTCVHDLIDGIQYLQDQATSGIYNLCSPQAVSRYHIASRLAETMGASADLVKSISLHEIPSLKDRPLNTSMICSLPSKIIESLFRPIEDYISLIAAL